jgi:small subunit ribosomal protein S1
VDVGLKCEAVLPRSELSSEDGRVTVAPGDQIDVWVERYDEAAGTVSVSHRKAARLKAWEAIERAFQNQTALRGRVIERIKGGLTVDIGARAFLPGSHADLRLHCNLDALVGQEIDCKVIKFNKSRENVVVSRKLAMEEEAQRRKAELAGRLVEGAEIVGRVKNLTDYGIFVDLGGLDGLLHITDLSWGRVSHPSEVVQAGQEIKVKVLKYDREKERVSLGLKQLSPDPWERVPASYHAGQRVAGRVVSIVDYGVFVELDPGVEGLAHISELTWSKRLKHPSKVVSVGDHITAAVLDVSAAQRRISLSFRQTLPDPWENLAQRFAVGSTVEGRVRNLTEFGAFVEVEEGVEGLIHLSNLSWNRNVKHPSEILKKGQKVDAVILSLDTVGRRLSLGLKQLQSDIWKDFCAKTRVDDVIKGKVTRLAPFGAFVELQEGIEGLCHVSEYGDGLTDGGPERLEVGNELEFRVIRLNPTEKKIGLSLKGSTRTSAPREESKAKEPARTSAMAEALSSAGINLPDSTTPAPETGPGREVGEGHS